MWKWSIWWSIPSPASYDSHKHSPPHTIKDQPLNLTHFPRLLDLKLAGVFQTFGKSVQPPRSSSWTPPRLPLSQSHCFWPLTWAGCCLSGCSPAGWWQSRWWASTGISPPCSAPPAPGCHLQSVASTTHHGDKNFSSHLSGGTKSDLQLKYIFDLSHVPGVAIVHMLLSSMSSILISSIGTIRCLHKECLKWSDRRKYSQITDWENILWTLKAVKT